MMDRPVIPLPQQVRSVLDEIEATSIEILYALSEVSRVVLVTNSSVLWIPFTARRFFPRLSTLFDSGAYEVYSARPMAAENAGPNYLYVPCMAVAWKTERFKQIFAQAGLAPGPDGSYGGNPAIEGCVRPRAFSGDLSSRVPSSILVSTMSKWSGASAVPSSAGDTGAVCSASDSSADLKGSSCGSECGQYSASEEKPFYSHVVSVGDGFAERCAVLSLYEHSKIRSKAVRFVLQPSAASLIDQLKCLKGCMGAVMNDRRSGDLYLSTRPTSQTSTAVASQITPGSVSGLIAASSTPEAHSMYRIVSIDYEVGECGVDEPMSENTNGKDINSLPRQGSIAISEVSTVSGMSSAGVDSLGEKGRGAGGIVSRHLSMNEVIDGHGPGGLAKSVSTSNGSETAPGGRRRSGSNTTC